MNNTWEFLPITQSKITALSPQIDKNDKVHVSLVPHSVILPVLNFTGILVYLFF